MNPPEGVDTPVNAASTSVCKGKTRDGPGGTRPTLAQTGPARKSSYGKSPGAPRLGSLGIVALAPSSPGGSAQHRNPTW